MNDEARRSLSLDRLLQNGDAQHGLQGGLVLVGKTLTENLVRAALKDRLEGH
jgi:hypothetical protein